MRRISLVLAVTGLMYGLPVAWAQNPGEAPGPGADPFAMWNVQQMIDRASGQVVKRYALTQEQAEFTRKLMTTGVNAFLDKHEQQIRGIFAEVLKYQISGNPPPPEKVQEWTSQAMPMYEEAKSQILEGNRQFREVLTEDQKKIHDIDLKIMDGNFKDAEQRLDRWRQGGYDPKVDFGPPPKHPHKAEAAKAQGQAASQSSTEAASPAPSAPPPPPVPPAPPAPAPAGRAIAPAVANPDRTADLWTMYVQKFIQNYSLDATQAGQAMQILDDTKKRAGEYLSSRKDEYQRLQAQQAAAAGDQAAVTEINRQLAELNRPVQVDLFNEMKQRLDRIPTEAQRQAYEQSHPRSATKTGPATASRPSTTREAITSRPSPRHTPANRPGTVRRTVTTQPSAQK